MYVLKDRRCSHCDNDIIVYGVSKKDLNSRYCTVVDYCECAYCGIKDILPQEDFKSFVSKFCNRK